MSKSLKAASLKFATLAAGLACAAQAMAVDLTVVSFGATPSAIRANSRVYLAPLRRPRLPGNFLMSQKSAQLVGALFSLSAL